VLRYGASVAVCTLNSEELAQALARTAPEVLAIVGTMHAENLGIERVIRNVLANPNIRFLTLCGDDTQQFIGHLPGQTITSLFENGLDDKQPIAGAKGKRPYVKNVSAEHVRKFKEQVPLVPMIREQGIVNITEAVLDRHGRGMPAFSGAITEIGFETVRAKEPQFYKSDPAGFLVVYPDRMG
jgi:tetrahydromethanopterin S-methyltransferase subunit A